MKNKTIKELLKEGYKVTDQWDNTYIGNGNIEPHPQAIPKKWEKVNATENKQ